MPTNETIARLRKHVPKAKTRGERIQQLFAAHTRLTDHYGETYRKIDRILDDARKWAAEGAGAGPGCASSEARAEVVRQVDEIRTQTVLWHQFQLRRREFQINELVPGMIVFPFEDEPPQSFDFDDLQDLGEDIATIGAYICVIPGAQGIGEVVVGVGVGMTASGHAWEYIEEEWSDEE